jgi:hypothetical protein
VDSSEQLSEAQVTTPAAGGEPDVSLDQWQALEALWRSILGLEANIESARLSANAVRGDMEAAFRQSLAVEEKLHASQADVSQWTQAKNRIHYSLPKVREFVHRATWALASVERKRLEEIVKTHVEPRVPLPDADKVREEMEHLQKARQVLLGQGNSVQAEGRGLVAETNRILGNLRRTAADNARKKKERDSKRR